MTNQVQLTAYETKQIEEIALWKSERPSHILATFRALSRPFTKLFTKVVPPSAVRKTLEAVEKRAEDHEDLQEFLREFGFATLEELRALSLEECDRLTEKVSARAEHLALLEGAVPALGGLAVPGVGGAAIALVDVPILFEASLKAIRRIGHCYGYRLKSESARQYVLGVLDLANAESPAERVAERERLRGLVDPQAPKPNGPIPLDKVAGSVVDDLPLEAVPIVGEVSSIFLDYAFVHRVDITARRVFQERWLLDKGKVTAIPPSPISRRRSSVEGVVNVAGEVTYTTSFALALGVGIPLILAARLAAKLPLGTAKAGVRDGAQAAIHDATHVAAEFRAGLDAGLKAGEETRRGLATA